MLGADPLGDVAGVVDDPRQGRVLGVAEVRSQEGAKTMPTRPPLAAMASSCASVRLREAAQRAWAPE